jgi:thymidylate synthase (FAD)
LYEEQVAKGVSRELARLILPINVFTEWYCKIDLHNLLHFLALRLDSHAQKEIRDYADAIYQLVDPIFPVTMEAFNDYNPLRGGMLLSRLEIDAIRYGRDIATENKRERAEFEEKFQRLNLPHPAHVAASC